MLILVLIGTIVAVLALFIQLFQHIYYKREKNKGYYEIIWKKSSSLKPKDILKERPYYEYYYRRPTDDKIYDALSNKKNLLVIGSPLDGKTRAIYNALKTLKKPCDVIIPKYVKIETEKFSIPVHIKFWREKIVVLDDLQRYVELQNFEYLIKEFLDKKIPIVATCRSDFEFKKVMNKLAVINKDICSIFGNNVIELVEVSEEIGEKAAKETGIDWNKVKFNKTIGSVFMRLYEMEQRFSQLDHKEKFVLRILKKFFTCGIYYEKYVFKIEWLKIVTDYNKININNSEWAKLFENLQEKEFFKILGKDAILVEEIYLEDIIKFETMYQVLDIYKELLTAFSELKLPDVLFMIGYKAINDGIVRLEKAKYMKIAIRACEEALKVYTLGSFPMDYGMTQNNLGNAYRILAEVEDREDNSKKALLSYTEAIKIFSEKQFPEVYPRILRNIQKLIKSYPELVKLIEKK